MITEIIIATEAAQSQSWGGQGWPCPPLASPWCRYWLQTPKAKQHIKPQIKLQSQNRKFVLSIMPPTAHPEQKD